MELHGRVVVVTGASAGIGEATAIAFAQRGARVALAARRLARIEELAQRIERAGGRAVALPCDVTDHEQLERLDRVVTELLGPPDVLVNNAGIPGGGGFTDLTYDQIESVVHTNLLGVLFGTRAFLPGMQRRGTGHVVNVASLAGRYAAPDAALYTATKHAVVAFSESLHYEAARDGVLVTAVNPAFVATEGFPQSNLPDAIVMRPDRVARAIVRVVRDGIAPEFSVPRWVAPFQVFRVLTPSLYRWGVRAVRRVGSATLAEP